MTVNPNTPLQRRHRAIAAWCALVVVAMVGASYAAVPFYNWFCRTTGFGGTPQIAEQAPGHILDRTVRVRFDSNVTPGLPWVFRPEQNEIKVRIGEVVDRSDDPAEQRLVRYAASRGRRQPGRCRR